MKIKHILVYEMQPKLFLEKNLKYYTPMLKKKKGTYVEKEERSNFYLKRLESKINPKQTEDRS